MGWTTHLRSKVFGYRLLLTLTDMGVGMCATGSGALGLQVCGKLLCQALVAQGTVLALQGFLYSCTLLGGDSGPWIRRAINLVGLLDFVLLVTVIALAVARNEFASADCPPIVPRIMVITLVINIVAWIASAFFFAIHVVYGGSASVGPNSSPRGHFMYYGSGK